MGPFTRRWQEPRQDRRATKDSFRYDGTTGTLLVGQRTVTVGGQDDNDAVLRAYLDLVLAQRDLPAGVPVKLRDDDIGALAGLLDLEDAELERRLVSFLGVSAEEAINLRARLRGTARSARPPWSASAC